MEKITFCIPSKTNLRYLKTAIPSIRNNAHRKDHNIIVFVDSDEDGTIKWLEENWEHYGVTYYINPYIGDRLFGIGKAYDFCIEKSTTDIFMIFHADMILGKNADLYAYQHLKRNSVVCSTRIEPPIHPNGGEKILEDFGMWPEEFKEDKFNKYVEQNSHDSTTTEGIFAPWMMYKEDFLSIGGHDPILHSCREDSDVFNRMVLNGFSLIQSWNSLVYHFTGRGAGSFDGDKERHEKWKLDMNRSTLEFIRKWGSNVNHTPLMKPIISPKYDVSFVMNGSFEFIKILEPWCLYLYYEGNWDIVNKYILSEQPFTSFDLNEKFKSYKELNSNNDDIIVYINQSTFNQNDFLYIQNLMEIIKESGQVGKFELGNMKLEINKIDDKSKNLIYVDNKITI